NTVDVAALKASSSSSSLRHRCGRVLSEFATSGDERSLSDEASSTVTSNETHSLYSDFNEEDEGNLQHYLTSRIHRERGGRRRRDVNDFLGSLDSLDSVGSRRRMLKKILSHLKKHETFDYDELMNYVDNHLEGEQKERMKLLVDELKDYKAKYLNMKFGFKNSMKKIRKKMKSQIKLMILLVPSITCLFVLLWLIVSMTMFGPGAVACAPAIASTVVTPSAVGAAGAASAVSAASAASAVSTAAAFSAPTAACSALSNMMVPTGFACCGSICKVIYAPFPLAFL
ncbi:hypothetical protein PCYB_012600, partial [Plasmodium cynomolgi strain B]